MQTYETLFITVPTLTEDEERSTIEDLAKIVTDGGGAFDVNERMGRRRLAYPIRKFNDGVYVRFMYDSESTVPTELERRLRLSDRVLRSLTVRLETEWAQAAKEQEVRDAQARVEAAERERLRAEQERLEEEQRQAAAEAAATEEPPAASAEPADAAQPRPAGDEPGPGEGA